MTRKVQSPEIDKRGHELEQVWAIEQSLSPAQQKLFGVVKDWLESRHQDFVEALYGRKSWKRKRMNAFEKAVFCDFCRRDDGASEVKEKPSRTLKPADLQEPIEVLRIITKLICKAAKLGISSMPVPRIPTLRTLPPSPFCNTIDDLAAVDHCRERINQLVEQSKKSNGPVTLEIVLASACIYGGILNTATLAAIIRALTRPNALQKLGDKVFVELSLSWRGLQDMEHRRWFPDVLTSVLLLRLTKQNPAAANQFMRDRNLQLTSRDNAIAAAVWKMFRRTFAFRGIGKPKSLKSFFSAVATLFHIDLPGVLVSYVLRRTVSHSLKATAFERLFGVSVREVPEIVSDRGKRSFEQQIGLFDNLGDLSDVEPIWLAEVRAALREKDRKSALNALTSLIEKYKSSPSAGLRVLQFAENLLREGAADGRGLAVSSTYAYVITVSKRFVCLLGGEDPATLEPEALAALSAQVLEDSEAMGESRGRRRCIGEALKKWFPFMIRVRASRGLENHGANSDLNSSIEAVYNARISAAADGLVPVDANFITVDEYYWVLDHIERHWPTLDHPHLKEVARILVVLGFRCGLRRMEALMLRVSDFCDGELPDLLVRPWALRKLKTKNATRKLPLYALLTGEELSWLRRWVSERKRDDCLFGITEAAIDVVPRERVFERIHAALRSISPDCHYHILRHSFATLTYWKLAIARCGLERSAIDSKANFSATIRFIPQTPMTERTRRELAHATEFADRLYSTKQLRFLSITRRHALAVASLLGHSYCDISFEHYIHNLDLLLSEHLDSSEVLAPDLSTVIKATGVPPANAYRWHKQSENQGGRYEVLMRHMMAENPPATPRAKGAENRTKEAIKKTEVTLDLLFEAMTRHQVHGIPIYEAAQIAGLTVDQFRRCIERGNELSAMRVSRGTQGHRHRMQRMRHGHDRLSIPAKPRERADLLVVKRLEQRFWKLLKKNPKIVQEAADFYVKKIWRNDNALRFRFPQNVKSLKAYLQFLKGLGMGVEDQTYVITADEKIGEEYASKWAHQLGWNWRYRRRVKIVEAKPNARARRPDCLQVHITFKRPRGKAAEGQFGFRYFMLMAAIATAGMCESAMQLGAKATAGH